MVKRCAVRQKMVTLAFVLCSSLAEAGGGKLIGTAGVGSIEGAGGGGLTPWAPIATYASSDELGASILSSEARVDDYNLSVHGIAVGAYDRLEFSYAHQDLYSDALSRSIRQNIVGAKVRLTGDLVYDVMPVVSLGLQHKTLLDEEVLSLVGAEDNEGVDVYLSAAKAWLNGPFNRTAFANLNVRYTEANETGLLGFGGDDSGANLLAEFAGGMFITKQVALGFEFRQKQNQLSALSEDHWKDLFLAWFPNKNLSITAAYLDLGVIAGQEDQTGFYISLNGTL